MESATYTVQLSHVPVPSKQFAPDERYILNTMHPSIIIGTSEISFTNLSVTESPLSKSSTAKPPASETSSEILEIIFDYALNKFSDTKQRLDAGRPKFLSVIEKFVVTRTRVEVCLPAFPFKSANKVYKVLGVLPDKAEEIALRRLNDMCRRVGEIYTPGMKCTIISDGLVYNGSWNTR